MVRPDLSRRVAASSLVFLTALVTPMAARAQSAVAGFVKTVSGTATLVHEGREQSVVLGASVTPGDLLKTGGDGRIGVTLKDDTRISLGPNTEISLAAFAYSPSDARLGFAMRVVHGVVAYVSGRIAKLAPDSIRIETPTSILGVRGTHLLISAGQP